MLEMNKVMLIGNLTRDPELSYLPSGMAIAKMGLAVSRRFTNKNGESQEEVAFIDIDAWGKTGEFCSKWFKKGTRIYVEGRLKFRTWEAQDGSKRSKLDVTADRVQFALPKSHENQQDGGGYQQPQQQAAGAPDYGGAPQAPPAQAPQPPAPEAFPQPNAAPPAPPDGGAPAPDAAADNTADDLPF